MNRVIRHARSSLRRPAIAAAIAIPLMAAVFWMRSEDRVLPKGTIETPRGPIVVEIASTPASRSAGLSNRERLHGIDGMLLKWDTPGRHPIWMAGMRFPLDIVWTDADGHVLAVLSNVPPCSADPCSLYEPQGSERSVAVIELPANTAAERGLVVGTTVRLPAFVSAR